MNASIRVHGKPLDLGLVYRAFNELDFENTLPKNVVIKWGWFMGEILGETDFTDTEKPVIRINRWLKRFSAVVLATILHEMVHIKRRYLQDRTEHGDEFQKEMIRLANISAFEGIW